MKLVNIYNQGRRLHLFLRDEEGNRIIKEDDTFFPYFYDVHPEGKFTSFDGKKLKKIFVSLPKNVPEQRNNNSYEADIIFTKRYLIDRVDKLEKCSIKYSMIDIEVLTEELPDPYEAKFPISCISFSNSVTGEVKDFYLADYATEHKMIEAFIGEFRKENFDLMIGYFLEGFDYPYLYNRIPDFATKISPIGKTRYGKENIYYPAGISIVDYMVWDKKATLNRRVRYTLDAVLKEELGRGKEFDNVDFSVLNDTIKLRNRADVEDMMKLEEKLQYISYFDEIRRLSKVEWEDLFYNSRVIDMLLLQEAKNQNIVLPMKPSEDRGTLTEKEEYEGAFREAFETGAFFNIGKYDLSSCYPNMIVDFCLDPTNIQEHSENALKIEIPSKKEIPHFLKETIENVCQKLTPPEIIYFIQNPKALLPTVTRKLIELKKLYKGQGKKYDAIKTVVNSAYGVFGNRFFRLYDKRIASATTFLARDVLHYVKDKLEMNGQKIIYIDTDSVFVNTKENLTIMLNNLILFWAEKFNKDKISTQFSFEGIYEELIILAKCRYKGWVRKPDGKLEIETKGIEAKRKDSTVFMKKFQTEVLERIRRKESKESIIEWIEIQKEEIKNQPLEDIAFPCKLGKKIEKYKNKTIFVRALENSGLEKRIGEPYYYIYVIPEEVDIKDIKVETEIYLDGEIQEIIKGNTPKKDIVEKYKEQGIEKGRIRVLHRKFKKVKDVIAFDKENKDHVKNVNWERMIERNIGNKVQVIFEAMKWEVKL